MVSISLWPYLLNLANYPKLGGHPGDYRMYYNMRRELIGDMWPVMCTWQVKISENVTSKTGNLVMENHRSECSVEFLWSIHRTERGSRLPPRGEWSAPGPKIVWTTCTFPGVRHLTTTAYHQQTDGQPKSINKPIVIRLHDYGAEQQRGWDCFVQLLTCSCSIQMKCTTGTTAFNLMLPCQIHDQLH